MPLSCAFLVELRGFEPRNRPAEIGADLHFPSSRVVTHVLRVLRICPGVLRDVTVLGQPIRTQQGQTSMPVELPGIEPEALPGLLESELRFRYVSFRFSPVRYLRFCFRVLTASRLISRKRERSLVRHGPAAARRAALWKLRFWPTDLPHRGIRGDLIQPPRAVRRSLLRARSNSVARRRKPLKLHGRPAC